MYHALNVTGPGHAYSTLAQLFVEPQPIQQLYPKHDKANIFRLNFDGYEGDYFMLKKDDCNGARTASGSIPGGPSFLTQLDAGGVATETAIANSYVNELEDGFYK